MSAPGQPHPDPRARRWERRVFVSSRTRRALVILLVILAGTLAYGPSLHNEFLNLDDDLFIVDNPQIPGGLTLRSAWWALTADVLEDSESVDYWQPATLVSRLIDGSLYGLEPAGHHFTNLLLHLANAVLLLLLLESATGRLWRSATVALIFATHPLHVSSVAWVTERKDVLSVFFSLLTLAAFARFASAYQAHLTGRTEERTGARVLRRYLLLAAGYALCLMSKPMTLPLPFLMLLVAFWPIPRERRPGLGRLACSLVPLGLLSAVAVFLYSRVSTVSAEVGSLGMQSPLSFAGRVVTSIATYPVRLLYPARLQHIYSIHPDEPTSWQIAGSFLLLLAVTAAAVSSARRRPFLAAGWLWYIVSLLPAATAFQTSAAADRFSYFPVIGVTVMIVWGVSETAGRRLLAVRAAAVAAAVMALALSTRAECRHWKDSGTLFAHLLELDPNHDIARRNLGVLLDEAGEHEKALSLFKSVLSASPYNPSSSFNVGVALHHLGRLDEALRYYAQTVRLGPNFTRAHFNSGVALHDLGRVDEALRAYAEALRIDPNYYWAQYNSGMIHLNRGDLDAALASFQDTLRANPRDAGALREIAHVHALQGRAAAATDYLRRALAIDPGDREARENLRILGARMTTKTAPR